MGGGSLMTPILVFLFGIPPSTAIGTDIAHGAASRRVGAVQHRRMGNVRARLAGWMLIGSVPASLLGVWLNVQLTERYGDEAKSVMGQVLGAALLFGAVGLDREEPRPDGRPGGRSGLGALEPRPRRRHSHRALRRLHRRPHLGRERRLLRPDAARRLPAPRAQGGRDGHLPRGDPPVRRRRRALGRREHRLRDPRSGSCSARSPACSSADA